ncbi:hypothetical protein [Psychroserpens luteus]|uniref:Uncharacterized protein n=1 Tax=Psychroserpens luteus TaxID=1434066 RepID=A0ABW5ZXG3_9FLAO|nr:hypothetical protein [Psychroserpens luteus]
MIITITLAISFLVAVNFLLLIFSCNKATKKTTLKQQATIIKVVKPQTETKQLATRQLAPTGS